MLTVRELWMVCGVMDDVIPCDRDRQIGRGLQFDGTTRPDEKTKCLGYNSFLMEGVVRVLKVIRVAVCLRDQQ